MNTGNCNGSGTVPVSNLWCEHGLIVLQKYPDLMRDDTDTINGVKGNL